MSRILVVDDAAFMRMMIKTMVEKAGHTVVGEGVNGADGVEKYKSLRPDLVTMDITMPQKDGIQALKEIMEFDKSAVVIMASAMGQQAMVMDAIRSGAKDFLVKPFVESRVLEAIEKAVRG